MTVGGGRHRIATWRPEAEARADRLAHAVHERRDRHIVVDHIGGEAVWRALIGEKVERHRAPARLERAE